MGTRAIIELTRLKCKWKVSQKGKGTDETPLRQGWLESILNDYSPEQTWPNKKRISITSSYTLHG